MHRLTFIVLLSAPALAQSEFVRAPRTDALVEVDAARKAPYRIPRTIFGTFLEPIGNAIYGGLWAQLLHNPSFEDVFWSAERLQREVEAEPALLRASRMGAARLPTGLAL